MQGHVEHYAHTQGKMHDDTETEKTVKFPPEADH